MQINYYAWKDYGICYDRFNEHHWYTVSQRIEFEDGNDKTKLRDGFKKFKREFWNDSKSREYIIREPLRKLRRATKAGYGYRPTSYALQEWTITTNTKVATKIKNLIAPLNCIMRYNKQLIHHRVFKGIYFAHHGTKYTKI